MGPELTMRLLTDDELEAVRVCARRGYSPTPIYPVMERIVRELRARRSQARLFGIPDPDVEAMERAGR